MSIERDSWDPSVYGERLAAVYDEWFEPVPIDAMIEFLAEAAGRGPALELGVGTGRIAVPLVKRGVEVHGIDISEAMTRQLRDKPGGHQVQVTIGDFADVAVPGKFSLIYVVANTFFNLISQKDQLRCFENAARRLTEDGMFVIGVMVPDLSRWNHGQRFATSHVSTDELRFVAALHDPVKQTIRSQNIVLTEDGIRMYPDLMRYAWPSELDLMAVIAGMALRERWGGWRREPFTSSSTKHISVYTPHRRVRSSSLSEVQESSVNMRTS